MSCPRPRLRELKACQTCAKAKSKCELDYGASKCKRCQRLNKGCTIQQHGSQQHKSTSHRPNSKSDILRLESKVDSMSQLLSTYSNNYRSRSPSSMFSSQGSSPPIVDSAASPLNEILPTDTQEASALLDFFRSEMVPLFPFVNISPTATPSSLLREKPILYLAILVVASQNNVQRQLRLVRVIREEVSRRFMTSSDQDLGVLEGLLVYLAWNHVHLALGTPSVRVIHMIMALVTELGLDKEPYAISSTGPGGVSAIGISQNNGKSRTLAERRVLLGALWLRSIFTTCSTEFDALKFGKYAESCCRILEDAMEFPTDIYLVQLVRMQRIADETRTTLYNEALENTSEFTTLLSMGMASLERDLRDVGTTLRLDIPQAVLMVVSYHTVQVHIYKIALEDRLFSGPAGGFLYTNNSYSPGTPVLNRHALLSSCWSATKAMIKGFLTVSPRLMFSLPYPIWLQLGHSLLIFSRLLTVKDEAWNDSRISAMEDFKEMILKLSQRLEEVMNHGLQLVPPRRLPEIFHLLVERLKEIARIVGGNTSDYAVGMADEENFFVADDALEAIDQFFAQEAAQASLLTFSSFGNESWVL